MSQNACHAESTTSVFDTLQNLQKNSPNRKEKIHPAKKSDTNTDKGT